MIEIRGGIRSRSQADGGEAGDNTYTPMTDCFFGGSLLMFATGDQAIKGLRGDVEDEDNEEEMESRMDVRQERICMRKKGSRKRGQKMLGG